jgi:glycosyltransferase involved in cell wall biosynthesis
MAEPRRVKEADVVTCESPWSAEQIQKLHPNGDIRVLDYGVHPSFYRVHWDPDPKKPILLFSGSLDRRKGIDILVDAIQSLSDRQWTCRILGEGPLRQELEARKLQGVEWLGTLPWHEMQKHLAEAWALVVPTRADTGPTVVKEARVIGLPVIGSINGGLRDYIRSGENGLSIEPLDAEGIAVACNEIMADYSRLREMGASGHANDREYFRPERCAAAFVTLYKEIADHSGE